MITRYEAYMDGVPLSSIAPEIIVKDISEKEAKTAENSYILASGNGSRVLRSARESLSVAVKFEIHAYNIERRQDILEQVQVWGKGRYLSVNTRPGKRLSVSMDAVPVIASALKWTQDITITFVSRETPFWEDEKETRLVLSGLNANGVFRPSGTVDKVPLEFTVTNNGSAAMTSFSASAGGKTMYFTNLGVQPGESFSLEYVDGIQRLPVGNRAPASPDDLFVECCKDNEVSYISSQNVEVVFRARGRFN